MSFYDYIDWGLKSQRISGLYNKAPAVDLGTAVFLNRLNVVFRAVTFIDVKPILWVTPVQSYHISVSRNFGDNRS